MTTTNQESDLFSLRIAIIFYRHTLVDINPVKPLNRPSGNDHIGLLERSQSGDRIQSPNVQLFITFIKPGQSNR